jgi:hypothetical protein
MPNISLLIDEAVALLKNGMCLRGELILTSNVTYDNILAMWNFHKLIVRPDYAPIIEPNLEIIRILGNYYKKYKIIKDTFTAHTNSLDNHLIMFAIQNSDQVLLCYKSIRRLNKKINPYIRIFFPKSKLDPKTFNLKFIPDKNVRIAYFSGNYSR